MPRLIDGDRLIDWLEIVPLENGMIYADTVVEYVREMPRETPLKDCENNKLIADALALLREQEPRVMTAEEVQEDELVWIEVPQSDEIWPALLREVDWFGHPKWEMCGYAIARSFLHNRYGKDWRCWTARPTDEQREAVKWDADD